jgi:uroporphyrin-3 C-methyltransferase
MNEPESPVAIPEPAVVEPVAAAPAAPTALLPPRRQFAPWFIAIALLGAVAYLFWRTSALETEQQRLAQTDMQQVDAQIAALARSGEQARRDAETLRARLDDAGKVNQSLREQLLGLGERARLVEDAIANLADKRLTGHDAMLLDESEMLLALGGERFALFHDPAATIAAYRLADTTLAAIEDPAFSTVRQSISAEIDGLSNLGGADVAATAAALAALRADAAQLPPARREAAAEKAGEEAHWWHVFGNLVRVRTGADAAAVAQRHDAALARQLYVLDLRDAEAALLARDPQRYSAAIAEAQAELKLDFDTGADTVKSAHDALERLGKAELAPPAPPQLGVALRELRNLRATHAVRQARPEAANPPEDRQ